MILGWVKAKTNISSIIESVWNCMKSSINALFIVLNGMLRSYINVTKIRTYVCYLGVNLV